MNSPLTHCKTTTLTPAQLEDIFKNKFDPTYPVHIKLHFGEPGNTTAFTPEIIKPYTTALHSLGLETILWDCPVFYKSPRDTKSGYEQVVKDKGFPAISPCEISDAYEQIPLKDGQIAEVSTLLTNAKNLCILTHVKGHPSAGFGATIKNIGIGAVSPKTKAFVHEMTTLADPFGWDPDRLGQVTAAALSHAPKGHSLFINIIKDVTQHCDCVSHTTPIIAPDLGILISDNPVAIDQASLDLIEQATEKDLFAKVNGIDPALHIAATAKYSDLTREYTLKEK